MVFLPERLATISQAGFAKQFTRQKKRMARNNMVITDKELQVRIFNNTIRNTFISGEDFRFVNGVATNEPTRYRLGPSFYFFRNNFYSQSYPAVNAAFESHLQLMKQPMQQGSYMSMMGVLSDLDKANLILRRTSFSDLLAGNPGGDTLRTVLQVKGDWLFNLFQTLGGKDEFNTWFAGYLDQNKFSRVSLDKFISDFDKRFGKSFGSLIDNWYTGNEQPGFLFTNVTAREIVTGNRSRYQLSFIASNPEKVAGLFNIAFRTGDQSASGNQGPFSSGGQPDNAAGTPEPEKVVFLEGGQAKRIAVITDAIPRAMIINSLFARNIPGEVTFPVNDILKSSVGTAPLPSEEIMAKIPMTTDPSEIIVDNEDKGFDSGKEIPLSPLKRLFGIHNRRGDTYLQVAVWDIPEYWQPIVSTNYFGRYVRSSVYTRSGNGDRSVTWKAVLDGPGYYDLYAYIGKSTERVTVREGEGRNNEQGFYNEAEEQFRDLHYTIYHDDGSEEVTVDYQNASGGWNMLGRYYLSADTAKVLLSNKSTGRAVIADAVRWVKQK